MIKAEHVGGGLYQLCETGSTTQEKCRAYARLQSLDLPDALKEECAKDIAFCQRRITRMMGKKQREIDDLKQENENLKRQLEGKLHGV